jgi:cobalt-zinc-cadmium efflux system outer membrane protein
MESIEHMKIASEYSEKVAKKMGSPSFGLGLNYVIISERTDIAVPNNGQDAFVPMISLRIPLYRKKYKAQKREASLNQESWKNMGIEERRKLQSQLETVWVSYIDAGRRISLYRNQSKIAEQTQNILVETYSTDGKDFEEILRVQRMLLKYELQIITALKDKNTAVAKIETLY